MNARRTASGIVAGASGLAIGYVTFLRSWIRNWGATAMEVSSSLPGDTRVPHPLHATTRAITIGVPPAHVWPWLVQLGNGRGGLYSYDFLDRLFGILNQPSADVILPAFQGLKAGDSIPMGAGPDWPVAILESNRTLLIEVKESGMHVTWVFVLSPLQPAGTRLVTRVRASAKPTIWRKAQLFMLDPIEFLMVRRMLLGIKSRAERRATFPSHISQAQFSAPSTSFARIDERRSP